MFFRDGVVNGVGFWTEFDFGDGLVLSTGICSEEIHTDDDKHKGYVR